jgi:hypothetical protein
MREKHGFAIYVSADTTGQKREMAVGRARYGYEWPSTTFAPTFL